VTTYSVINPAWDRMHRTRESAVVAEKVIQMTDTKPDIDAASVVDVDGLEAMGRTMAGYGERQELHVPKALFDEAIAALRQQQEELKERAIDLDNVGQKRKYFLHQCREKDAEIASLKKRCRELEYEWQILRTTCDAHIVVIEDGEERCRELEDIHKAAQNLYDNRLGWSDGRNPYAPPEFWERLGDALKERE